MTNTTQTIADLHRNHELDVYGKRGITLIGGKGAEVWDDQGKVYIDCIGGHGAANMGHGHPNIMAAIRQQIDRLMCCPGSFYNDAKASLLARLTAVAPPGLQRAFLCNSGTEAVEAALKFARISTGRTRIIAMKGGFHGRTFGAMSATFHPKYAQGCGPLVPDFDFVPFNNADALENAFRGDVAAVILELVQGEGGVRPVDSAFLDVVLEVCRQHGALLIVDEVQTGLGRTGRMFACEHYGLAPDVLCLAKSMAGGLPMGAVLVNDRISIPLGRHGSTFGGNPLVCAAASAAIGTLVEEGLAQAAADKGRFLVERLQAAQLPLIREIRHLGLMIGIELKTKARPLVQILAEEGILVLTAGGTVLRLLPPLVITEMALARVAAALIRVLSK